MILILGKGTLGQALVADLPDSQAVGRPEYDFSKQKDCDRLVDQYAPDILINTVGMMSDDIWEILITNYVSTVYISMSFYEKIKNLHIINVSSACRYWVSYPGIENQRLIYNVSKEAVSNFGMHMTRQTIDQSGFLISTIEPIQFPSKINNFAPGKISVHDVVEAIQSVISQRLTHCSLTKS